MSATHLLIPVDDRMKSAEFIEWFGRPLPDDLPSGRNPTLFELEDALKQIPEFEIQEKVPHEWAIYIDINIDNDRYLRIEARTVFLTGVEPHTFSFSGEREGVVRIVSKLTPECGAFILMTEGENPELVVAGVGRI